MNRFKAKTLASQLLDAIDAHDASRVRSLIEQGAHPDGWWNPEEAAEWHRRMKEEMRTHAPPNLPELPAEFQDEFDEAMRASIGDMRDGPSSYEIPLHRASESGSVKCIRALLDAGADINKRDYSGETALFQARTPAIVHTLIGAGTNINAVTRFGYDAIQDRFSDPTEPNNDPSRIESDLAVCKALLNAGVPLMFRRSGKSRLYNAAFSENLHGMKFLLDMGHPIDADSGNNALHAICWHWDYGDGRDDITRAIVRTLLDAGLDPNARGEGGNTPMHEALSGDGSNLVAVEELLAAGADINAVNDQAQTPLHLTYETLFDYERVVPFMLKRGANPLLRDKWGQTVVDIARRMIRGENPMWRIEMCEAEGGPPCGWKSPAAPGDAEHQMLELLEEAAKRFS